MYEMRVPGGLCIECTWCIPQEVPYQMVCAPLPHLRTHCYRHIQNVFYLYSSPLLTLKWVTKQT